MKRQTVKLPADVEPTVHGGVHRCTSSGRVLNQRYRITQPEGRMQIEFELVRER